MRINFVTPEKMVASSFWLMATLHTTSAKNRCNDKNKESVGFLCHLCACRPNWASRTSWGWWDGWDDTALQTQDLKFEPWRSDAEHAPSRSRRLPTILLFYEWAGKKYYVSLKLGGRSGARTRDLRLFKHVASATAPAPPPPPQKKQLQQRSHYAYLAKLPLVLCFP